MKIASTLDISDNGVKDFVIDNYELVSDSYDFITNNKYNKTSVQTLKAFSQINRFDYIVFRDSLETSIIPNWTNLSFSDRKECAYHFKYPSDISDEEWVTYYSLEEHEINWNYLVDKTRDARLSRLFATFKKLSYHVNEYQAMVIYNNTKAMCFDYYYANLPNLALWISNGSYPALGIDYSNTGFAQMPGYSTELMYMLLDILINGNYK